MTMLPRVLTIAGSDPSGGAGIQADIKTIQAFGGYAMAAITALTAQNTTGVFGVMPVPPQFVADQVRLCLEDIGADAIKTGMLFSAEIVEAVVDAITTIQSGRTIALILDPVMVAKGGAPLLQADAVEAVKAQLIPRALLITPNIPEAELLSGMRIHTAEDMQHAGEILLNMGAHAALIKGGHMHGDTLTDVLIAQEGALSWQSARIHSTHTHGTGCTMASAIATLVARGFALPDAISHARDYIARAIGAAPRFGHGHGPLNHLVRA